MMGGSRINIIELSDIHLGNSRTKTPRVLESLRLITNNKTKMQSADLIILAGDVFDRDLRLSEDIIGIVEFWIIELLNSCVTNNICLRVLEGTPSHDRGQGKHFETINNLYNINADIRYINTLHIEHIDRFNIDVLYIPDEYKGTTLETQNDVSELLVTKGLNTVHYAIMHGMFEHQVPPNIPCQFHDNAFYLSIVSRYIFIGHVHLMSVKDRILSAGSLDRLKHNEEESKGYWYVESNDNMDLDKLVFVENTNAKLYIGINLLDTSIEETTKLLDRVEFLEVDSYVAVKIYRNSPLLPTVLEYQNKFLHVNWSIDVKTTMMTTAETSDNIPKLYESVPMNKGTISGLLKQRFYAMGVDDNTINKLINKLEEHL